jgi:hypothetical protein
LLLQPLRSRRRALLRAVGSAVVAFMGAVFMVGSQEVVGAAEAGAADLVPRSLAD